MLAVTTVFILDIVAFMEKLIRGMHFNDWKIMFIWTKWYQPHIFAANISSLVENAFTVKSAQHNSYFVELKTYLFVPFLLSCFLKHIQTQTRNRKNI